jgi:transposase-like protein
MKGEVATDIRAIFNASSLDDAKLKLDKAVRKYEKSASRLANWLENNILQGLTVFALPQAHWRLLRTTNGLERVNEEIRRRTRVVGIFPNEGSCLRLVTAILMEISDDWETGKAYLTFD